MWSRDGGECVSTQEQSCKIVDFPVELWCKIEKHLSSKDMISLMQVSRGLRNILASDEIWERRATKHWFNMGEVECPGCNSYLERYMYRSKADSRLRSMVQQLIDSEVKEEVDHCLEIIFKTSSLYIPELVRLTRHLDESYKTENSKFYTWGAKKRNLEDRIQNLPEIATASKLLEGIRWQMIIDSIKSKENLDLDGFMWTLTLLDPHYFEFMNQYPQVLKRIISSYKKDIKAQSYMNGSDSTPVIKYKLNILVKCLFDVIGSENLPGTGESHKPYDISYQSDLNAEYLLTRCFSGDTHILKIAPQVFSVLFKEVALLLGFDCYYDSKMSLVLRANTDLIEVRLSAGVVRVYDYIEPQNLQMELSWKKDLLDMFPRKCRAFLSRKKNLVKLRKSLPRDGREPYIFSVPVLSYPEQWLHLNNVPVPCYKTLERDPITYVEENSMEEYCLENPISESEYLFHEEEHLPASGQLMGVNSPNTWELGILCELFDSLDPTRAVSRSASSDAYIMIRHSCMSYPVKYLLSKIPIYKECRGENLLPISRSLYIECVAPGTKATLTHDSTNGLRVGDIIDIRRGYCQYVVIIGFEIRKYVPDRSVDDLEIGWNTAEGDSVYCFALFPNGETYVVKIGDFDVKAESVSWNQVLLFAQLDSIGSYFSSFSVQEKRFIPTRHKLD
ncbi:hypothetical protein CANARDRAFT_84826 [[Candida] arabinofermentans NRRL YB-2248]|uniref:F-box domain-containing protein n=1 Tax=[Candida] arabinofermentans NRRL YB-2248 TaxID=983967 RepID=A0A1E4T5R7_9ASCO|nr:hypothetical protein CANARDRAFT_84826 [[Candida] arabinofermentans NRRL YB-2248]